METAIKNAAYSNENSLLRNSQSANLFELVTEDKQFKEPRYTKRLHLQEQQTAPMVLFQKHDGSNWIVIKREASGAISGFVKQGESPWVPRKLQGIPLIVKPEAMRNAQKIFERSQFRLTEYQIQVLLGLSLKGGMMEGNRENEKKEEIFVSEAKNNLLTSSKSTDESQQEYATVRSKTKRLIIEYPLHFAAKKGDIKSIQKLISREINVNKKDKKGKTALQYAIKMGQKAAVKVLLQQSGIDQESKDLKGRTALELAVHYNRDSIKKLLQQSTKIRIVTLPNSKEPKSILGKYIQYLDSKRTPEFEVLGSGAFNTVYKVTLQEKRNVNIKVLKREKILLYKGGEIGQMLGIDPNDPKTCFRNILYCTMAYRLSEIAEDLGLDKSILDIVPHARLNIHKRKLYTSMILAEGSLAAGQEIKIQIRADSKLGEDLDYTYNRWKMGYYKKMDWQTYVKLEMKRELDTYSINDIQRPIEKEDKLIWYGTALVPHAPKINLKDPKLNEVLTSMQLLDLLLFQLDRNLYNFFIKTDAEGNFEKLTTIDNDFCVSSKYLYEPKQIEKSLSEMPVISFPKEVSSTVAKVFLGLKNSDIDAVFGQFQGIFGEAEAEASKKMLDTLKKCLNQQGKHTSNLSELHLGDPKENIPLKSSLQTSGEYFKAESEKAFKIVPASHLNKITRNLQVLMARVQMAQEEEIWKALTLKDLTELKQLYLTLHQIAEQTEGSSLEAVRMLLYLGEDIESKTEKGRTLLHIAVEKGQREVVKLLLSRGADITVKDDSGQTPCHLGARKGRVRTIKYLFVKDSDCIYEKNKRGKLPLHVAAAHGHYKTVQKLLKLSTTVDKFNYINASDNIGATPLYYAAVKGRKEVFKLLLDKGADIISVLHCASLQGNIQAVKLVLEHGVNINAVDNNQRTALYRAVDKGHTEIVRLFLEHGVDIKSLKYEWYSWTALNWAARKGHKEIVKLLLEHGADINFVDFDESTAVYQAAGEGHAEIVRILLEYGADINRRNRYRLTALDFASKNGHIEVIKLLLEKGIDINAFNNDGWTALHFSAQNGDLEAVELLLEKGTNPTLRTKKGSTALHFATQNGGTEVIRLLLEKGIDINASNNDGWTALHFATQKRYTEVIELLLEQGANSALKTKKGSTPLHWAAQKGYIEGTKLLIKKEADINILNNDGWTALHIASDNGHSEVIKVLLDIAININTKDNCSSTALHLSAIKGHCEAIKALLNQGADIEAVDRNGTTPLHWAVQNGHIESIKVLLEQGANLEFRDSDGYTPLHFGASNGKMEAVELLLAWGADIEGKTASGSTALHTAVLESQAETVRLLLKKGANIECKTADGSTPLQYAASEGHMATLQLLLEHGASTTSRANDGWTPLHGAAFNGHVDITKLLVEKGAILESQAVDIDGNYWSPLALAISQGNLEVIELLSKEDEVLKVKNIYGIIDLHRAAQEGNLEAFRLLLRRGLKIDIKNAQGRTALHQASERGHINIVKILLYRGAVIGEKDNEGITPFEIAKQNNYTEIAELLSN